MQESLNGEAESTTFINYIGGKNRAWYDPSSLVGVFIT